MTVYKSSPHTRFSTIKVSDLHFCLIHIISFSRYSFQTLSGALVTGAYADRRKTLTFLLPMSFSTNQIAIMQASKSLCNSEPMAFHAITPLCLAPTRLLENHCHHLQCFARPPEINQSVMIILKHFIPMTPSFL